jgi:hypothetical protein
MTSCTVLTVVWGREQKARACQDGSCELLWSTCKSAKVNQWDFCLVSGTAGAGRAPWWPGRDRGVCKSLNWPEKHEPKIRCSSQMDNNQVHFWEGKQSTAFVWNRAVVPSCVPWLIGPSRFLQQWCIPGGVLSRGARDKCIAAALILIHAWWQPWTTA